MDQQYWRSADVRSCYWAARINAVVCSAGSDCRTVSHMGTSSDRGGWSGPRAPVRHGRSGLLGRRALAQETTGTPLEGGAVRG